MNCEITYGKLISQNNAKFLARQNSEDVKRLMILYSSLSIFSFSSYSLPQKTKEENLEKLEIEKIR